MPFRATPWTFKVDDNPKAARLALERAIRRAGSVAAAADELGLARQSLYRYMERLSIKTPREEHQKKRA